MLPFLLGAWTTSPIPSLGAVFLGLVELPLLGWLGLRCASAYVGRQIEREGTAETRRQAEITWTGRLVLFLLALGVSTITGLLVWLE